jgi:preprotein translocase subunit SecE
MKNVAQFLNEVRVELSRVTWPSFDEFVGSTIVALFVIAVFSIYVGTIDRAFAYAMRFIFAYGAR